MCTGKALRYGIYAAAVSIKHALQNGDKTWTRYKMLTRNYGLCIKTALKR